jgi:hypothetical protein
MSTNTIVEPAATTAEPGRPPRRLGYKLAGAVFGLAALGAVVVIADAGESTGPASTPGPASTQPAPSVQFPPTTEIFAGCLNDVECSGEPSHLPPGYWTLPYTAAVD